MKAMKMLMGLLALTIAACGNNPNVEEEPLAAPQVLSSNLDESVVVNVGDAQLELIFDQNVKISLADKALVTISPSGSISNILAYDAKVTVKFTTTEYETLHTITIPAGCISGFHNNPTDKVIAVNFKTKNAPEPEPDPDFLPERGDNAAWKMAEKLALGYNLGNQMDAYYQDVANETCWGNEKATQQTFTKLKSYGFTSVRIPITWIGHIGEAPDYKIDNAWMERVAEIVGYAEKAGLQCIINTHHDENHNSTPAHWLDIKTAATSKAKDEEIRGEIAAVWTQIAERFRDKGDWLIFESFNEINDGGWGWSEAFRANPQTQYDILNGWNQVFVDAVRATGGNNATRWLGIPGYASNIQFTIDGMVLPNDSAEGRLMVAVHCYDPSSFCGAGTDGKYEQWGHTGASGKKPAEDETTLRSTLSLLYANYVSKGIPCYLGEFGCVNKTSETGKKFQAYYLEYFCKAARCYGLPALIWDNGVAATNNGEAFGYVHHATGEFIGNGAVLVPLMVKAQTNTSESYTLESIYNNAPR